MKEIEINEKQVVKKAKMKKERNKITILSKYYSTVQYSIQNERKNREL